MKKILITLSLIITFGGCSNNLVKNHNELSIIKAKKYCSIIDEKLAEVRIHPISQETQFICSNTSKNDKNTKKDIWLSIKEINLQMDFLKN